MNRIFIVLLCLVGTYSCSLKKDLTTLGNIFVNTLDDRSCVLNRLTERSKKLDFQPGTGKPYRVSFQIKVEDSLECDSSMEAIDVQWNDLEIDEFPDMGKSSIRLTGNASVRVDDQQLLCRTDELIIAYSDWYEVKSLSVSEFRPPKNPQNPVVASEVAFERFLGEFIEFVTQDCL